MDMVVGVAAMTIVVVETMVGYNDCASSGDGGGGCGCGYGGGGGGGGNNGCGCDGGAGGVRLMLGVVGGDGHFIFKKIKCMDNKK
ncbi:hypothetical protein ACFX2G_035219 [Malus domestica]